MQHQERTEKVLTMHVVLRVPLDYSLPDAFRKVSRNIVKIAQWRLRGKGKPKFEDMEVDFTWTL